ncbi:cell division protein FtsQ/DivIB [Ferrimonas marina]|uniref:Cell division protein FtsQ n=1 Tax=Ferrimonas marina TaxID=299255 RepID=A0A1M5XFJ7_9GAMM|nr:cell division protein FtsQ/DivIB [Ferrimonas marina]SHH98590.1 cell division protein FtsQ [Ferrimonas marina]
MVSLSLPQTQHVRWDMWFGLAFLLLVLLGLARGAWWVVDFTRSADSLPIEELALIGERQYTSDDEVRQALLDLGRWSLFTADVEAVRETLTALPWVDRASVRREWPNRLRVYLLEQVPVARWHEAAWLNERAQPFQAPPREGLESLPQLSGPPESGEKVWEMWQQLSELLALHGFQGQALQLNRRHAWTLRLEGGIELALGRTDTLARTQRFIDLWPQLEQEGKPIERVDLRYDTGLAVRWQEQEE